VCAPHLKVQAFVETSMNIALFALAAVMIVGGIVSVIQGFPFVRLESGLAMTIAGATTASAGAVVLGLAVVAGRLRGLERAVREAPPAPQSAPPAETGLALPGAADPSAALRARPSLAATAASLGAGLGAGAGAGLGAGAGIGAGLGAGAGLAGAASTRPGLEPTFFDPAPPAPEPSAAEPLLPNLLPADAPHDRPEPRIPEPDFADVAPGPETRATEDDLFDVPAPKPLLEPVPVPVPEPAPALGSAPRFVEAEAQPHRAPDPVPPPPAAIAAAEVVDAPAEKPEPTPEPPAAEPTAPVAEEPQVVGTYASGGNTYVMYSTGVIEADTPRGRFTFGSLDELKAFVEAGGETDSRGAA
jgi:hypothetical protein